jgi:hypothetical protein
VRRAYPIIALSLFGIANTWANTVEKPIFGREYNDISKRWIDREVDISAGMDKKWRVIFVLADTGLGLASVMIYDSPKVRSRLRLAAAKALEWSDVAAKNHAGVSKPLDCFGIDGFCHRDSLRGDRNQVEFSFWASDDGNSSSLIVDVRDLQSELQRVRIYFGHEQMTDLLRTIDALDDAFAKAKDSAAKESLFK